MLAALKKAHIGVSSGILFALLNLYFLYNEMYWFMLIPFALAVVAIAVFRLDWLWYIIVFATPLSVTFDKLSGGLGLTLPTDPLLFGAMLLLGFRAFIDIKIDRSILLHPISVVIGIQLVWIALTSLTSELPVVSVKFFIAKLWFIIPSYLLGILVLQKKNGAHKFIWASLLSLSIVIIYTIIRHQARGFGDAPAHWVMQPFYFDHTGYGAIIAMFFPFPIMYMLSQTDLTNKMTSFLFFIIISAGLLLSYTRAAWVSIVLGFGMMALILLRIRWYYVAATALIIVGTLFAFRVEIQHKLEKNRQDSSSDFAEHVESITNVATDASNLERLNRWDAAWSMFKESPVFGKGPGTYSFLYAPYQKPENLTVISTNFGDAGNAHSEYLGPLCEQGILGLLLWLTLILVFYFISIKAYYRLTRINDQLLMLACIFGLTTYLAHGFLNNFLDTDKAAVPFYAMLALVVVLDLKSKKVLPTA